MSVLLSTFDPADYSAANNRAAFDRLLASHEEQLALARAGGGVAYLDLDAPFLELSPLAAWGTSFHVSASIVTGIGVVAGVECVVIAHDPTVRGGAMNPHTLKKNLRALEIARVNRMPVVNLVESGGRSSGGRRHGAGGRERTAVSLFVHFEHECPVAWVTRRHIR